MIDQMALLYSSIPVFNTLSDLRTDLERSFPNHSIECTAIDRLLGVLCAGTGDLVSDFIQQTSNTLLPFGRPRAMSPECRPQLSALDALKWPYPDCMRMCVWWRHLKCHLWINHQGQLPPLASHWRSNLPWRRLYSPHGQIGSKTPEPNDRILAPELDQIVEETDRKDDGLNQCIRKPGFPAQESDTEETDPGETPISLGNQQIEVLPSAGRTFWNDPDYEAFRDHINTQW